MQTSPIAAETRPSVFESFVAISAILGLLTLIFCADRAQANALENNDAVARQQDSMPPEANATDAAFPAFERSDCATENAACRSRCSANPTARDCGSDPCTSELMLCLAHLPLGKSPSLPMACRSSDQDAYHRLERQGELLDADPTLFAESYNALIRARIACRAGNYGRALDLYDEIMESMAEKRAPGQAASPLRR